MGRRKVDDVLTGAVCLKCKRHSGRKDSVDVCRRCQDEAFRFSFDFIFAFKELFMIEHRDRAGTLVPFVANDAQVELVNQLYRIMFLEIAMQVEAGRRGEPTYIVDVVGRVDRGEPIYPWEVAVRLCVGKSRRRGVSAAIQAIQELFMAFHANYPALLMAHNGKSAEEIGRGAARYYEHWHPAYLHHRPGTKHNSVIRLEFDNESRRQVFTAGTKIGSEESRGWAFIFDHFSESAFYESATEVVAATSAAPANAWLIYESTGNGPTGFFYRKWQKSMSVDEAEEAWFTRDVDRLSNWDMPRHTYKVFFSWLDDPGLTAPVYEWEHADLDRLDDYEKTVKAKFPTKFTRNKIKWRRAMVATECQGHPLPAEAFFSQENPSDEAEMWQSASSKVYTRYACLGDFELASKTAPLVRAYFDGYSDPQHALLGRMNLLIHVEPKKSHFYIAGVDGANGMGQDYHYGVILDRTDGTYFEEVASIYDRQMDAKSFGHAMTALAELYNNAFIVPEIQTGGLAVASTIIEDNRYTKVYQKRTYGQLGAQDSNVFRYGIFTTNPIKHSFVAVTRALFDAKQILIRTPFLIEQLRAYEFVDEKYSKPEGGFDDGVDALHLALFGARYAPPIRGYVETVVDNLVAAIEDALPEQARALFAAVTKKIDRSVKAAKRQGGPGVRQALDPKRKRPGV